MSAQHGTGAGDQDRYDNDVNTFILVEETKSKEETFVVVVRFHKERKEEKEGELFVVRQ